jgi:alpha-galactosidase
MAGPSSPVWLTGSEPVGALASRRQFLQWASGAALAAPALAAGAGQEAGPVRFGDDVLVLEVDARMRSRFAYRGGGRTLRLTASAVGEYLERKDGVRIRDFALVSRQLARVDEQHGPGTTLTLTGHAPGLEKTVAVSLYDRYPGFAFLRVTYRNTSDAPLELRGWANAACTLPEPAGPAPGFWSYSGSSYENRRNWVQPVVAGFAQENFLGMSASDYGGGTPILDVWRRDCGLAIGHVETTPRLVSLPIAERDGSVSVAMRGRTTFRVEPGASFATPETFVSVHRGDHFATMDTYRRVMAERGVKAATPPEAAYQPIWCAWGYERDCTLEMIEGTLPKVRELGLDWAVIDDGWQSSIGDWRLNPRKYPNGEADMHRLVASIRAAGLKSRLWYSPLAVAPGSDTLHDHTDMLLLDREGAVQNVSYWNCFYLCPAYAPTVDYTLALVRKFLGEWGHAGLKIDGQHLNGVAPCYNPAHHHARPEESVEGLHDFYRAIYETARAINPDAVVELCPCGTSYSIYNFPYMNQAPASDPESSWQVRLKGKTMKGLMGPGAAFAGDHVELSDRGDDFASTVGIGAIVSTKFTWPRDPKPKDSFLLTPEREAIWRHWIALYREMLLPKGVYRGGLYDIGFDKPEAHAIEKDGRLYYAFYAPRWRGEVELRGLGPGRYRLRDYVNDRDLGVATNDKRRIRVEFEHALLMVAEPA